MKVDTDWFYKAVSECSDGSLRAVAAKMRNPAGNPIDHGQLGRLLKGEAEMTLRYVQQLAVILDKPVLEIIKRCGLKI